MQLQLQFDEAEKATPITLTAEQQDVFDDVSWTHKHRPYTTIGGYAGTGKSVLLQFLAEAFPKYVVCSPSWQSVSVLRMRGVKATTAYRVIYKRAHSKLSDQGRTMLEFDMKDSGELGDFDGIICDEAGIVPSRLHEDLLSVGKPLIYLGDHGQLPPVNDSLDLMRDPHYRLEEIHRNASDIVQFSKWLREGRRARDFDFSGCKSVEYVDQGKANALLTQVDQVACSWNHTRHNINFWTRKLLGRGKLLEPGDRIMTLSNNHMYRVFNGMTGTVTSVDWEHGWVGMESDYFGKRYFEADLSTLDEEKPRSRVSNNLVMITYAYARTAYSMQGSECGSLLVIEEDSKGLWAQERANYMLATRAKEKLYWCRSRFNVR